MEAKAKENPAAAGSAPIADSSASPAGRHRWLDSKDDQPWPPADARKSGFDSSCNLCGESILGGTDLITETGHYRWTHWRCARKLSSYGDDRLPIAEIKEWPSPPSVEYRCQGITGSGESCPVKPQVRWIADPDAVYYCGRHKRQRPEGSKDIPEKGVYPAGWKEQPQGLWLSSLPVSGESFCDGYPDNLYRIREALIESDGEPEGPAVVLRRDATHEHDPNAVEVHVPMINGRIGYLSRNDAAQYAPWLDAGDKIKAYVGAIGIHPDSPENPGAWIHLVESDISQ